MNRRTPPHADVALNRASADVAKPAANPAPSQAAAAPERAMRTCPICGKELSERKCKLYCPDPVCGYFLSCSDFY